MVCDIIIPTIKSADDVSAQVAEIQATAGCECRVYATCQSVSAAQNRNLGLDHSDSNPFIMVDDDISGFPHGWATRLIAAMTNNPLAVMVSAQLAAPNGHAGPMMGGCQVAKTGTSIASQKKLPPACAAIRRTGIRFCEQYIGSGWEDDDYCARLRVLFPNAQFLVCHDVWVTHRNEQKNQRGTYWDHNRQVFERIWGSHDNPQISRYSAGDMPQ